MKILVSNDLSDLSKPVVDEAAKLARAMGGELTLLHVVRCEAAPPDSGKELLPPGDLWERETELREVATALEKDGLKVDAVVKLTAGAVYESVVHEAGERGAAMIVCGSHGRGKMFELLVGSTTQGLIRTSPVPVLVVTGLESVPAIG